MSDHRLSLPIIIVAVVVFSVATTAALHRWGRGRLALSGVEYLLVGAIAGPFVTGLLDDVVMSQLDAVVSVILGLAGFSLGLHLRTHLRGFGALQVGVIVAVITAGLVGGSVYGLLSTVYAPDALYEHRLWIALALGAAAPAVSAMAIDLVVARTAAAGSVTEMVRGLAASGNFVAVVIAGAAIATRRASLESSRLGVTEPQWLAAILLLGIICGLLFRIFLGRSTADDDRTFLASCGVIILTSGLAAALGISPLFTCAAAGATVSLTSRQTGTLEQVMERLERPALAMLSIFAGAMWRPIDGLVWVLPLAYVVVRLVAVRIAARLGLMSRPSLAPVVSVGSALLAQGSVAAAIAINHAQIYPDEGPLVLATILTPMVLIDAIAPGRLRRFFSNAGESGRSRLRPAEGVAIAEAPAAAPEATR
ncbi:MAG TPA: cation:proton antiporter [Kofleriaceae bacterium]|nr:cation:proton antiporter [Kofleriaceae bacterium]